jgi:hypothetical protein
MDMAMRSFVVAGGVALVLVAAGGVWWVASQLGGAPEEDSGRIIISDGYDDREGSVFDEFGGPRSQADDRITITTGDALFSDDVFDRGDSRDRESAQGAPRFGAGPRFDWSGSSSAAVDTASLPRDTAADRVESDCRTRGGGSYACRCLVRMARQDLNEAEFDFLSLSEERETRAERLGQSGLAFAALGDLSVRLVALDASSTRRCGAGLTP